MLFDTTLANTKHSAPWKFYVTELGPEIDNGGNKILDMFVENIHFLDSLNYLPNSLKSMPNIFDLRSRMGYYSHFLNTANNLD